MTVWTRVAALATLSLGIVGLAGVSAPVNATQAATETIVGEAFPKLIPAVATTIDGPTVEAVATITPEPQADDPTALDSLDTNTARYQSLADAVANQDAPGDISTELRCLAGAIYYESKGEPLAGQLAVAEVIINRARSGRYPKSLCGVVTQPGQFSFVRGGAVPAINPALGQWKTALAVAQVALGDAWESPASNAMFFHARYVSPGWGKARVASIGNHVFYR
jgi:spore germination cell wall hydrolase CwlJ-like protein